MVVQRLQNRAVIRRTPGGARSGESLQRLSDPLQALDLALYQLDLLPGLPLDGGTRGPMPDPERQQLLDLLQREPQLLGVLDEPETSDSLLGVLAISGRRA